MKIDPLSLKISEYWHISRVALSGKSCGRYDRMVYVRDSLVKYSPALVEGMTSKEIWLRIGQELEGV